MLIEKKLMKFSIKLKKIVEMKGLFDRSTDNPESKTRLSRLIEVGSRAIMQFDLKSSIMKFAGSASGKSIASNKMTRVSKREYGDQEFQKENQTALRNSDLYEESKTF
jgi:hypothetical protein